MSGRRLPAVVVAALVCLAAVVGDVVLQQALAGPAAVTVEHRWPAGEAGAVWVTVDPSDGDGGMVTLTWGPWRTAVHLSGGDTVAYTLTKAAAPPDRNAAVRVTAAPGAAIAFGEGPPPPGFRVVDLDGGWRRSGPLS